jgi:hypothetical protein
VQREEHQRAYEDDDIVPKILIFFNEIAFLSNAPDVRKSVYLFDGSLVRPLILLIKVFWSRKV